MVKLARYTVYYLFYSCIHSNEIYVLIHAECVRYLPKYLFFFFACVGLLLIGSQSLSFVLITVAFDICLLLQEKGCAIVYCRTREDCVVLSDKISNRGIAARPYHAGRRLSQSQLRANGNLLIRGIPSQKSMMQGEALAKRKDGRACTNEQFRHKQ